ncbi:hypothetical protein [Maricaulis sp.]|uniref:hypothetical protein n=1 Tax=Maricaulis sp. TaxID=1486257 RepID=UPI00261E0DC1|nr:hypothetical protein [Maricaulis sp.]
MSACSSTRQRAGQASDFARDETRVAVEDAVGLPRQRPGQIMVDEGDDTVPTPYGGDGSRRRCSTVSRDIARLTVILGPDIEEEQRLAEAAEPDEDSWVSRGAHAARRAPGAAADATRGLYRSTIVGLNPIRPVVRFIGGAGRIEGEAREQRDHAQRRRAYLRGLYDGFGCPESYMERAFEAYGLIEQADGSHKR